MSADIPRLKVCYRCRRRLPLSCFHIDRSSPDGRQAACRQCAADITRLTRKRRKARWLRNKASDFQRIRNKTRRRTRTLHSHGPCAVHNCHRIGQWHHMDYSDPGAFLLLCSRHHHLLHVYQRLLQEVADGFYEEPMPGLRRKVYGIRGLLWIFFRLIWLRLRRILL